MADLDNTKRLYQGWEVYTDEANSIKARIRPILQTLFDSAVENNTSIRDLSHLLGSIINEMESETIILRNSAAYEEKRPRIKFSNKSV